MQPNKDLKRQYSIQPYDPEWISQFESIKEKLIPIFKNKAVSIEHVGSTSIPGMSAKPLIDVLITIKLIEPFIEEKKAMEAEGYLWGENYIEPNSIIFYKENPEDKSKTENIHVCVEGSGKALQFIQTRDYVRAHPERAAAYSELKKQLVLQYPGDYPAYRAEKKSFLDETERLTIEWLKSQKEG